MYLESGCCLGQALFSAHRPKRHLRLEASSAMLALSPYGPHSFDWAAQSLTLCPIFGDPFRQVVTIRKYLVIYA